MSKGRPQAPPSEPNSAGALAPETDFYRVESLAVAVVLGATILNRRKHSLVRMYEGVDLNPAAEIEGDKPAVGLLLGAGVRLVERNLIGSYIDRRRGPGTGMLLCNGAVKRERRHR